MCSGVIVRNQTIYLGVADQAAMLLLSANELDIAQLLDGSLHMLTALPASTLSNWSDLGGSTNITGDDTYVVANQAAMLALSANVGDIAYRSDNLKTYRLTVAPATTLANWQVIAQPTTITGTSTHQVATQAAMLALGANVGDIAIRSDVTKTYRLQALPAATLANWIELVASPSMAGVPIGLFYKNGEQAIINTITQTEVLQGLNVAGTGYTFPANSLVTGCTYELEIMGTFSCNSISSPGFEVSLGGSLMMAGEVNTLSASTDRKQFIYKTTFYFTSVGAAGSLVAGNFAANGNGNTSGAQSRNTGIAMPISINTTIDRVLSAKMNWSSAVSAGNIIRIQSAILRKTTY